MTMNKVILVGLGGADTEIKNFSDYRKVISFSLATREIYRDKEQVDRTDSFVDEDVPF